MVRNPSEVETGGKGVQAALGYSFCFKLAPTTPAASCFRLLGAIACEESSDLCHFDAEQALVQSTLEGDVFVPLRQ